MSAGAPTVSVVMAAYNGAGLIGETLASLSAQTFGDFELVVVDDGSTDATRDVISAWGDPRLRLIVAPENGGPVRARNLAFAHARGRYIAGLDQDDLCSPDRFARQVAYLDAQPETVLVGANARYLDGDRERASAYVPLTTPTLVEWLLHVENPLVWSSVMLRAEAARTRDPFTDPDILYAEDFDLYHRMARLGRIARLDDELILYRRHAGGASRRFLDTMESSAARVLTNAYAPIFGEAAADCAQRVVHHVMGRAPPPDRATLEAIGDILVRLQAVFLARHSCDEACLRLIRWETARRWAGVVRSGLRSGTITLFDVVAARRDHLGLGHAGIEELAWSRAVGSARNLIRT